MDLGSESVDDNHVSPQRVLSNVDGDDDSVEIRSNGSIANGIGIVAGTSNNHDDAVQAVNLTPPVGKSPGGGLNPTPKGQGLRKWKRIRRNLIHEGSGNAVDDSSKKRGMPGLETPVKPRNSSIEIDLNYSEGSVASVNMLRNGGAGDRFAIRGASPEPVFVGTAFAARADSENSEDRSSKSSTAASAPKSRYDLPAVARQAREKNRGKNTSAKSGSNYAQSAQPGRGRIESSKKHRGEGVKIEKENSHSSMESDSRSSNFFFMQDANLSSNGKQSRRSMSHEGENSDDAHASEQQFSEEVQTGYRQENAVEGEDFSHDNLDAGLSLGGKGEKSKKHTSFSDMCDPLLESMRSFQSVQEALEKEVQKIAQIGKEPTSEGTSVKNSGIPADLFSSDLEINESNLTDQLGSGKTRHTSSSSWEAQILTLKQQVKLMESKLDETRTRLEVKESRVTELEDIINISKSLKEGSGSTIELHEEQCRELETEVESLFRQKIEAEVEYVVMKRTTQTVKFAAGNRIALLEEQEAVFGEQTRMLNTLGEAEIRSSKLKERVEELGKYRRDILGTEEVFTIPKRLCKPSPYEGVVVPPT